MTEMNSVARFLVNASAAARNRRRYAWIRTHLPLTPGAVALEIGCGNGDMADRLVEGLRPSKYLATDIDPKQLALARRTIDRRYPAGVPAALTLEAANMVDLPYASASVDSVFAFLTIHHAGANHHDFAQIAIALAEIDRVLRPGGYLVYEEFIQKEHIRSWLTEHSYTVRATRPRWRREMNLMRKSGAAGN